MAAYYCSICHLWDDNPEHSIYHCPYCNLCRQGLGLGLDSCHCMQCNTCMHLSDFSAHKCRNLNPCPICQESLNESTKPYRVRATAPPLPWIHVMFIPSWTPALPNNVMYIGCDEAECRSVLA